MKATYKLLSILLTIATLSLGFTSPAQASLNVTPVLQVSNGGITVVTDASGNIYTSKEGSATQLSYTGLSKNGVSSLVYDNGNFIASGFFHIAYSADGSKWKRVFYPIGEKFNAGNIISDEEFFNKDTMTVEQIQQFLNERVPNCLNGNCLKEYKETTFNRASSVLCGEYSGAESESAATIIYKVSQACNVNPQVLLVLLQKEQGLVTSSAPTMTRYQKATGYGCPDFAACNTTFFGFYNQVYLAARQFQRYKNPSGTSLFYTWFPVGKTTQVQFHPNVSCGTSPVTIENQATAGLYYYTPYQPNAAAMDAIFATGDTCSAYGNRNFWQYYNAWFNDEKEYKSWIIWLGAQYMALDGNGSLATSSNLTTWKRLPNLIDILNLQNGSNSTSTSLQKAFRDLDGVFKAVLSNGQAYSTTDGITWLPATVVEPPKPEPTSTIKKAIYYKVVKGDTMSKIAGKYKTTTKQLLKWNPKIKNANLIKVGQKLIVGYKTVTVPAASDLIPEPPIVEPLPEANPAEEPTETVIESKPTNPQLTEDPKETVEEPAPVKKPVYYKVVSGDTLSKIATKYKTTVSQIMKWNKSIKNANLIKVGQKLIVGYK